MVARLFRIHAVGRCQPAHRFRFKQNKFANICKNFSTKERLSEKIAYLCFVLCAAHTDILKRKRNFALFRRCKIGHFTA